ncbi:MAG: ABC transporter permease [Caldiserica bacterium]|nr:ABC transporter permease [Caldisericota bacterium]MDH7563215.1 ABC transporter permease [Caldisericota bacterium]
MNFKKAWAISSNDFRSLSKDKLYLLWLIFIPILWITLMSVISGGGNADIPIGILVEDTGASAKSLVENLSNLEGIEVIKVESLPSLEKLIENGKLSLGIVIPEGFSAMLGENKEITIKLLRSLRQSSYFVEAAVEKELRRIEFQNQAANFVLEEAQKQIALSREDKESLFKETFQKASESFKQLGLKVEYSTLKTNEGIIPQGAKQSSPGFTIMFVLFGLFLGAGSLVEERRSWTLARILTTPTSKATLLCGKFLAFFQIGIIQFLILVIYGQLALKVDYGSNLLGVIALGIFFDLSSVAMSIFLASLVKTYGQAEAFSILLANLMGMLGGSWWPLEIAPPSLQAIGKFTPVFWGVNGLNKLITYQTGFSSIIINLGVLFGFAVFFLFLGILLFRYE